jgi:transcription elongation factor GreA
MNDNPSNESITPEGIVALRTELEELEGPRRTEMAARIKEARELGDLKENADYHIAKDDQGHLEARIRRLRERLRKATVVEAADAPADSFAFGRTAEVLDESSGRSIPGRWSVSGRAGLDVLDRITRRSRPPRYAGRRRSSRRDSPGRKDLPSAEADRGVGGT